MPSSSSAARQARWPVWSARVIAVGLAGTLFAQTTANELESELGAHPTGPLPKAEEVLANVRANLPSEPLLIRGQLLCGGSREKPDKTVPIETRLHLGEQPARATYIVQDRFGTPCEQLTVTRHPGDAPHYQYAKGLPPSPAPLPDLHATIEGTDVTWLDLSLGCLWWTEGHTTQRAMIRGRDCLAIEFPATPPYPRSRIWIDERLYLPIQMEELDDTDTVLRRLLVKNLKKMNDLWMVKDMEIRRMPSGSRTLIVILEVQRDTLPRVSSKRAGPGKPCIPPP